MNNLPNHYGLAAYNGGDELIEETPYYIPDVDTALKFAQLYKEEQKAAAVEIHLSDDRCEFLKYIMEV